MNDFERAIFTACLVNPKRFQEVSERVDQDDFSGPGKAVYLAMSRLSDQGFEIDHLSLRNQLQKDGTFEGLGGLPWMANLAENLPSFTPEAFKTWLAKLKEDAKRFRIVQDAMKLHDWCLDPGKTSEALIGQIQAIAFDVDKESVQSDSFSPSRLAEVGEKALDDIMSAENGILGIPSGLPSLDRMTGGFRPGNYVAIGARPSVGKTSLALQIAQHAANLGFPVAMFSMEMEASELALIRACAEARVSKLELQNSGGDHYRLPAVRAAIKRLATTPLYVEKLYGSSLGPIRAKAARMKAKHGLDLVVIDYIQLMRGDSSKKQTRNDELAEISAGLKSMAGILKCPVIVVAQLNREASKEPPKLSHFRDCGGIEADADVALLLHRKDEQQDRRYPVDIDLIVDKNRTGACGTLSLKFDGPFQSFLEPEYE